MDLLRKTKPELVEMINELQENVATEEDVIKAHDRIKELEEEVNKLKNEHRAMDEHCIMANQESATMSAELNVTQTKLNEAYQAHLNLLNAVRPVLDMSSENLEDLMAKDIQNYQGGQK